MTTLETRIISGKGLLRVPQNDNLKKAKILTLHVDVIRPPKSQYLNLAYSPAKSRFANLNFVRDGYIIQQAALEYGNQVWEWHPELAFQGVYATACAYEGVLVSFINLGVSLGLTPIELTNYIKDWKHQRLWFDEIFVKCYAETAIRMVLSSTPYDYCPDQNPSASPPPPPPPPPPPNYPPGAPLGNTPDPVSPPYEGTDDEGDTVPFPGDVAPPEGGDPGDTQTCRVYDVVLRWKQGGDTFNYAARVFGEVGDARFRTEGGGTFIEIWCRGTKFGAEECTGNLRWVFVRGISILNPTDLQILGKNEVL